MYIVYEYFNLSNNFRVIKSNEIRNMGSVARVRVPAIMNAYDISDEKPKIMLKWTLHKRGVQL